jgi:hypothetical protein
MLAEAVGNLFRTGPKPEATLPEIKVGKCYRHIGPGNLQETAKVVDVGPDAMGIPHVRFEVLVERCRERHNNFAAVRTLNLETFSTYFSEALEA